MTGATRTIWVIAAVAVVSLAAGLGLSKFIISPADAAAQAAPPVAGPVSVPIEMRALENTVVMRADAGYEDATDVKVEVGSLGGLAVVTGQVPEVGATIDAGSVILEVTGRPVILLPGELPVYRTLLAGVSGPDVRQLKEALGALGIGAGDPAGDVYDAATAAGVRDLYARAGYEPPSAGEEADDVAEMARESVRAAQEGVDQARAALDAAGAGAPQSERIRLQGAVDSTRVRHEVAVAACEQPTPEMPCDQALVIDTRTEHQVAIAALAEGTAAPDTSAERAMLASAQRALSAAQEELAAALGETLTPLPASEVVYLPAVPRRVDAVHVARGATVAGNAVMSVSGATLELEGAVPQVDAQLLTVGAEVTITLPDGAEVPGSVTAIGGEDEGEDEGAGGGSSDRTRVVIQPTEITEEQRSMLQGANVRVEIPVSSTGGEVLAVPIAALTAGPGGESRVEVLSDEGTTTLVTVVAGLAAGGFVEITTEERLEPGDRVVIPETGGVDADDEATDGDAEQTEEATDEETEEEAADG